MWKMKYVGVVTMRCNISDHLSAVRTSSLRTRTTSLPTLRCVHEVANVSRQPMERLVMIPKRLASVADPCRTSQPVHNLYSPDVKRMTVSSRRKLQGLSMSSSLSFHPSLQWLSASWQSALGSLSMRAATWPFRAHCYRAVRVVRYHQVVFSASGSHPTVLLVALTR